MNCDILRLCLSFYILSNNISIPASPIHHVRVALHPGTEHRTQQLRLPHSPFSINHSPPLDPILSYNQPMILDLPLILETRRNHALEHATLHMLGRTHSAPLAGHSNPTGYFILGDVTTDDLRAAAQEAWTRLNAGEHELAIHPGCGTNIATTVLLAGSLAWLPLKGRKSTLGRVAVLPLALAFAAMGFALARPLGPALQQRITTEADLGNLQIVEVRRVRNGVHRVITKIPERAGTESHPA